MKNCKLPFIMTFIVAIMFVLGISEDSIISAYDYGRIAIECEKSDITWELYMIGTPNSDGSIKKVDSFINFPVPSFTGYKDEFQKFAESAENYINTNNITFINSCITNLSGSAVFSGLNEGWYVAVPKKLVTDDKIYTSSPVIVCITDKIEFSNFWSNDVTVYPKVNGQDLSDSEDKDIVIKFEWPDEDSIKPDSPITIVIYRDGEPYQTVILDDSNEWTYIIPSVPDDDTVWSISQKDYPDIVIPIYKSDTVIDEDKPVDIFIIQNIINPVEPSVPETDIPVPVVTTSAVSNSDKTETTYAMTNSLVTISTLSEKLPQTGQLWWPVPVLSLSGVLLISIGMLLKNKQH